MIIPWFQLPCSNMLFHQFFFDHGIVVCKDPTSKEDLNNNVLISHNDRFSILSIATIDKGGKYAKKQIDFFKKLIKVAQDVPVPKFDLDIISKVLINSQRRTEIFLPIMFVEEEIGIYLHAWIANSELSFSNVKQYVTAGCLFGSSLEAKSKNSENSFTLIQIDMDFFLDKKIDTVVVSKRRPVYEDVLFHELERLAKLIQALSPTEAGRILFYHLPYYDYILFVSVLLVRKRITFGAFEDFYQIILKKSEEYIKRIMTIFEPYAINVTIESPYQNIFGDLAQRDQYTAESLLNKLNINLVELTAEVDLSSEDQKKKEKELIQNCWNKLLGSNLDSTHQKVWKHFSLLYDNYPPNSFKELLERANPMMVARASWGSKHYTTCSVVPHSEKQIQVGYSKLLKSDKPNKVLSEVLNLTIFDPVVTCAQEKNIGVFSCDKEINNIEKIIQLSQKKLFFSAPKNLPMTASSDLNIGLSKNL